MQIPLFSTLIIGNGETGNALYQVLSKKYPVWVIDRRLEKVVAPKTRMPGKFYAMHICIPPTDDFDQIVEFYRKQYQPKFVVIHASVPVGTSARLRAFHSPIRGVHPHMVPGLKTFVKYLAPKSAELAKYFEKAGITIEQVDKPETTEALKLWDTTYYGWNIIFEKLLHEWCAKHGVDYQTVYQHANRSYNEGYTKLGRNEVVRPVLRHMEGGIGGHCVMENLELFSSPIADFLREHNVRFKNEGAPMPKVSTPSRKGR